MSRLPEPQMRADLLEHAEGLDDRAEELESEATDLRLEALRARGAAAELLEEEPEVRAEEERDGCPDCGQALGHHPDCQAA